MKSARRHRLSLTAAIALLGAASCAALTPTEWQHRQAVTVVEPGLVRVELPAATFDSAGSRQEDLRVLDPSGRETAVLVDRPPVPSPRVARPEGFETKVGPGTTVILIKTGSKEGLSWVTLDTPAPFFLRAARIEISESGFSWTTLDDGVPLFREWGAEKLSVPLGGRVAGFIRITVSDNREVPLPFVGAWLSEEAAPAPEPVSVGSRITSRDEFAGESVLTVALDGRNLPLAAVAFETKDPLFMRRVTISVREMRDAVPGERIIGSGTIFRVALGGGQAREGLELPFVVTPATRELLIHIHNGDSQPLAVDAVTFKRWPVSLLFMAPAPGAYSLLTGNPQVGAPQYDLAAFAAEMRGAKATTVSPGPVEDTPDYHAPQSLGTPPMPEVPLAGAPLDATAWKIKRAVQVSATGVQELELDLGVLSKVRSDFGDLRLLHAGNQIPYVLEQPGLARSLSITAESEPDPKRPSVSIWKVQLPKSGLPVTSIVLSSSTNLFERQIRIFEKRSGQDGGTLEDTLSSGSWNRTPTPGAPENRAFVLPDRMDSDVLWIECDNGDNPAISLGTVQAVYPVVRMVFKVADSDGYALAYGNADAMAPRYDLGLVSWRLLTSPRSSAHLGDDVADASSPRTVFAGLNGGFVFWGALSLVVVVLLVVVAKLLPKPKV
ncbi:MAG TPA: hypothetical protein VFE25_02780 [Opitutaceae bacterium]|jgi:hypothetical protein|nr:hypothetical protein [Opitutaceae bacterium]